MVPQGVLLLGSFPEGFDLVNSLRDFCQGCGRCGGEMLASWGLSAKAFCRLRHGVSAELC